MYNSYFKIGKNKSHRAEKQLKSKTNLANKFNNQFDVTHADCDRLSTRYKSSTRLKREKRKMVMSTENLELKECEQKLVYQHFQEEYHKEKATEVKKYTKTGSVEQISDSEYEETGDEELLISKYHQQKTRETIILEKHSIQTITKQKQKVSTKTT